jgi:hypothetical protein
MNNTQAAPPPSNAKEISFSALPLEYLRIITEPRFAHIMHDLGEPTRMQSDRDDYCNAYPARKVEEVLPNTLE